MYKFFEKKDLAPLTEFLVSVIKRISFKGQKARTESEGPKENIWFVYNYICHCRIEQEEFPFPLFFIILIDCNSKSHEWQICDYFSKRTGSWKIGISSPTLPYWNSPSTMPLATCKHYVLSHPNTQKQHEAASTHFLGKRREDSHCPKILIFPHTKLLLKHFWTHSSSPNTIASILQLQLICVLGLRKCNLVGTHHSTRSTGISSSTVKVSIGHSNTNINPSSSDHCIKFELRRMNHTCPPLTYELSGNQTIHQPIVSDTY